MAINGQLNAHTAGFGMDKFPNPRYIVSPKHKEEGWSSEGHALLGYRVARNFTNKKSPCFGTIVAQRRIMRTTPEMEEGWYFFNLHDDGDTEELTMQDVMTSVEMWVWYAHQEQST